MPKVATEVDLAAVLDHLAERPSRDDVEGRILDAAGTLLITDGLAGLEVDRVAERSGVGRSTVYRRFDGRNTLIAATLAHEAGRFLSALAGAVDPDDPVEDQVVAAFATGLRVARLTGLDVRVREEPLLLRLLTVDAGAIVAAARDHLVALAPSGGPSPSESGSAASSDGGRSPAEAAAVAELLIRLAISFVVTPESVVRDDEDLRRLLLPVLRGPRV